MRIFFFFCIPVFTLSSPSYSTSIETSAVVSSVMTRTPSTPPNVAPTVPLDTSGLCPELAAVVIKNVKPINVVEWLI